MSEIMKERDELLKQVMAYDFAVYELTLYLDTHPKDKKALELHHTLAEKANGLTAEYEGKFGSLTAQNNRAENSWTWALEAWPWDNQ